MPPRSPLPQIEGLDAARLVTPAGVRGETLPWATMEQWLRSRLPSHVPVASMVEQGAFVYEDGAPVRASDPFRARTHVWFHREVAPETQVPGRIHIIHRDARVVVVDKPPFLATMPRGSHVRQTALVRLRHELDLPDLSPMHRLDRATSGLLAFTTERRWRGPYQQLFDRREVSRTYWALAPLAPDLTFPLAVRNHLEKRVGGLQTRVVSGRAPNAETLVEFEGEVGGVGVGKAGAAGDGGGMGVYRLTPRTGRTHQLRAHLNALGIPIVGDALYPEILDVAADDFSTPLQLLAGRMSFVDPVDGQRRTFRSVRGVPVATEGGR